MSNTPPAGTITEWSDEDWLNFRKWLVDVLFGQTVEIIFTKADGTERVMNCTLLSSRINYQPRGKEKNFKPQTRETIAVWDVDKGEWRSFKVRSITNIIPLILKYND